MFTDGGTELSCYTSVPTKRNDDMDDVSPVDTDSCLQCCDSLGCNVNLYKCVPGK